MNRIGRIVAGLALVSTLSCGSQQVPATVHRDPNVVTLEGTSEHAFVPVGVRSSVEARIRISTGSMENIQRPPVNIALVVDTSGSMDGRAIEDAKAACLEVVNNLVPGDRIAVVAFHSQAEVLVPTTAVSDATQGTLRDGIGAMRAQGTTNLEAGLELGLSEVWAHFDARRVNRIVLLSDGVPNDATHAAALAARAGGRGVPITTLGLGPDYNETLLASIAEGSGGSFHYIASSVDLAAVFREELFRLKRLAARNAVAVLTPGPDVTIEQVLGHGFETDGTRVLVPIGDVLEGEPRDLLVRLNSPARRDGATVELLDVTLEFDDALTQAGHYQRHAFLGVKVTANATELGRVQDPDMNRDVARIEAAQGALEAIRLARSGDRAGAERALRAAVLQARAAATTSQDAELLARANAMESMAPALAVLANAGANAGVNANANAAANANANANAIATATVAAGTPRQPDIDAAARTLRQQHDLAMRTLQR